jgi:xanthine dehydrogenase accessory factor
MKKIAHTIREILSAGRPVVLATIISQQGSTPRTAGTKMVVRQDGGFTGTIGGGLLEAKVLERAAQAFATGLDNILNFDLTHEDVAAMDMICGGRMEVLLELITPKSEHIKLYERILQALAGREKLLLATAMEREDQGRVRLTHLLLDREGRPLEGGRLSAAALSAITPQLLNTRYPTVVEAGAQRLLVEPTLLPSTIYMFGAGHVAVPTAALAALVDFQVVVLDDRAEFADRSRFPEASAVKVLSGFDQALAGLDIDRNSYLIIVTRGHLHDKVVLAQALATEACYIGMIGSRRKRNAIYHVLLEEGFSEKDLDRVHSPIGLAIGAETPEEIAVSIVAELVQVRAGLLRL